MTLDSQRALGIHLNRCVQWELARVRKAVAASGMFWFIDIPRTSSTSIRVGLGETVGYPHGKENTLGQYSFSRSGSVESSIIGSHVPVFLMRHLLGGDIWDKCFKFSVLREPSEWLYSLFLYVFRYGSLGYKSRDFEGFLREFLEFSSLPLVDRVFPGRMIQSEYLLREGLLDVNLLVDFSRRKSLFVHLNSLLSLNLDVDLALIQGRQLGGQGSAVATAAAAWNGVRDQELLLEINRILKPDFNLYLHCAASSDGLYVNDGQSLSN